MPDNDYSAFQPVEESAPDPSDFTVGQTEAESAPLEAQPDYSGFIPVGGQAKAQSVFRAAGYGPNAGDPRTHATTYGPLGLLRDDDIAVSPNMLKQFPLGSNADIVDPRTGKVVYANQRVADYSYIDSQHPNHDVFEQRHVQDMGHMVLRPSQALDYSAFEPVSDETQAHDYSAFQPVTNQPEYAATDKPVPAEQPAAKPDQANPWDIGKFLQTFVGSGVQQLLESEKGQSESQLHPETRKVLPYGEDVQQAREDAILKDPNTSREEADDIISQRNQRLSYLKATAQQNVEETTAALNEAGSRVDQGYEATPAGQTAKTLGTAGASMVPALTGPFAPLALATQMGGQAYAGEKDRATAAAKKAHPEWTDEQIEAASTQAAENAATTSAETGVVLSLLPVPKLGGLLARFVERVGMRGTYMVVAGAAQDISANKELQNIDPTQALYDGVLKRMPANFAAGGAFELPGAIGEAFTGRPNAAPGTPQEQPEVKPGVETAGTIQTAGQPTRAAAVEENGEASEEQPEKIAQPAIRLPDDRIIESWSHGNAALKELRAQGLPDNSRLDYESGFTTTAGRFVSREEALDIARSSGTLRNPEQTRSLHVFEYDPGSKPPEPPLLEQAREEPNAETTEPEPAEMYSGITPKAIARAAGETFKPFEELGLPNREVLEMQPHTEELVHGIDEFRAREGELQGKWSQLNHEFAGPLMRNNKALDRELNDIGHFVEKNGTFPPNISPEAQNFLAKVNNGLAREIGDRMRQGGFKVVLPDGTTRPFRGAPPGVTPMFRTMRPDVARTLSEPLTDPSGKFTPGAQKLYDEGVREGFFTKPEDLAKWKRQYRLDHVDRPGITNLERARTTKYPSFFYTYSGSAMLGKLAQQASEVARLEAFGQKLGGSQDAFDRAEEKLNADDTIGDKQREKAFRSIDALRKNIYGQNRRSWGVRLFHGATSAGLAGSPHTSLKIWSSMLWNVPAYRGIGRQLQGTFNHIFSHSQAIDYLRGLGLKSDVQINLQDDPFTVKTASQKASNIFTGILRIAGHALAQDNAKSITAQTSKIWLDAATRQLQRDPGLTQSRTRMFAEDIERRGIDPKLFSQQNIPQALKDRFVREDVNDLQTAYRPEDYPAWQATQAGSMMFQFGHWAYNASRTIVRDSVLPMIHAYDRGDFTLGTRYFARLATLSMGATVGSSELWRQLDQLFGRPSNVATIGEIMQAFTRNDPQAAHMLVSRFIQDVVAAPILGIFGDVANIGRNVTKGTAGETHFFNPLSPAGVGYLNIVAQAINEASQQGGRLSNRQKTNFATQMAGLVKGYYDVAENRGVPLPGHAEAEGRREIGFVKSRLDLFYEIHPEWDKRQKGGGYAGNPHTPYLQDINEALISGNAGNARQISLKLRNDLGLTPKQLTTSLRESINAHRPIPTGTTGTAYMRWARASLTPDELIRMQHIERVYENTARAAGLPVKPE